MKQFNRQFLEEYRRNPRGNNSLFNNYYNPAAQGNLQFVNRDIPNQVTNQSQINEIIERWPEGYLPLLPAEMQGYNSTQILQELRNAYTGNQNLANQRTVYNNNLVTQRNEIDKKGKDEERRLHELDHYLRYSYPAWYQKTAGPFPPGMNYQNWVDYINAVLIRQHPYKSQFEANETLRRTYGNKYPPIKLKPEVLQKYGLVENPPNIIKEPPVYRNPYGI